LVIVHFAEYAYGGVATYLRNTILSQLQNKKVTKIILFCSESKSEKFEFKSKKFINIRYTYNRTLLGVFKMLFELRKAVLMHPDIIHLHSSFAGLGRIIISRKRSFSVIYSSHGWSFLRQSDSNFKHEIYAFIERILSLKTDKIVNISNFEQQAALKYKLPASKMIVIYNSIPSKRNSYKDVLSPFKETKTIKIGFVGRLDTPKGFPFLVKALQKVNYNFELMVIGKNIVDTEFNSRILNSDRIHYLGWIDHDDIDSYFKFIDFLIVPSLWEGFGLVALEAMKNSKPVLSSDAGGLPEIVDDGINGYTFETLSIDSFQEKFKKMVQSDMTRMGENGYEIMEKKFNYQKLQNQLFVVYQASIEKGSYK